MNNKPQDIQGNLKQNSRPNPRAVEKQIPKSNAPKCNAPDYEDVPVKTPMVQDKNGSAAGKKQTTSGE